MHFQNKNVSFDEMNLKFLSALMKYGNKLNYKILKDKFILKIREDQSLIKSSSEIETEKKIISAKLEKYDTKNLLKKSISKFIKLSESAKEKKNFIIAEMINFLEEKNKNFSSEEKEKINDFVFTNISSIIDYIKLVDDIPSSIDYKESLTIFKFLYENLYYTGNKFKSYNNNFDKLIENALEKSFTAKNTNETFLSQIIQIFWKYMIYNKSEEAESIFTKVSCKFIESLKGKQNLKLVKTVLKSL